MSSIPGSFGSGSLGVGEGVAAAGSEDESDSLREASALPVNLAYWASTTPCEEERIVAAKASE